MTGSDLTRSAKIKYMVSDMRHPCVKVIRGRAPRTRNILDRFHIAAQVNKAIDQVRAHEARELRRQGRQPTLKGTRWILLKNRENLSPEQKPGLADLLKQNLTIVEACLLKEDPKRFRQHSSDDYAGSFPNHWCDKAINSGIAPMPKVAHMLRRHHGLTLNWFRAKKTISSGPVEGLNNKAKQVLRKGYGYRSMESMKNALYQGTGYPPMPLGTH